VSGKADAIRAIHADRNGTLWIGTDDGLLRYDPKLKRFHRYRMGGASDPSLASNEVSSIAEDRRGILWIGTHQGLSRLEPETGLFTRYLHAAEAPGSLADDFVEVIYIDRAQQIWVGGRGGLDLFDPASGRFFHHRNDATDRASQPRHRPVDRGRGGVVGGHGRRRPNAHDHSQTVLPITTM
jgi:ligand-binding sensor domain-containing protein